MSYELSFSPDFFYAEDDDHFGHEDIEFPLTVWQALKKMKHAPSLNWQEMCEDVFPDVPWEMVDIEMVMEKVRETNSCSDLRSPVEVYIDESGWHSVKVYDERRLA